MRCVLAELLGPGTLDRLLLDEHVLIEPASYGDGRSWGREILATGKQTVRRGGVVKKPTRIGSNQ
jgi:hypothetical protein